MMIIHQDPCYNFWRTDTKLGDNFDVLLNKVGHSVMKTAAGSPTAEGAILLYPNAFWENISFERFLIMINHELRHIIVGQTMGAKTSVALDKFFGHEKTIFYPAYTSDLWIRKRRG